jgi:crotonobetainyl-CoA:carnitine CoA-transferase CaiB-like acyl-CoA transferase
MLPLAGIRVFEVSVGPVTGLATMILADFGAEVVRIEPVGGDPQVGMASSRLWRRGKTVVHLDLASETSRQHLRRVILETAEAVVLTSATRELLELGDASIPESRADLVRGVFCGLSESAELADWPAEESLAAALSGRMMSFEGAAARQGPVFSALQVGVHATSQSLAGGLLAALHQRQISGRGSSFTTSLLRGMLPYDLAGLTTEQLAAKGVIERAAGRQNVLKVMPRIYYHAARTRDGEWLQFGNLLPHLQQNFLQAARLEAEGGRMPESGEALEEFRDRMLAHIAERDLADWMEVFISDGGVVAHPYQTTQQALADPDLVANQHVVDTPEGRQLGLVARLSGTPGEVGAAPAVKELKTLPAKTLPQIPVAAAGNSCLPLAGVTVVEAATIIAAPLAAATLADLGARVIKLEPLDGDPFRQMMGGIGAAKCNTGKQSICLNLKAPEGQQIAAQLVRSADIFIHNYRPGVPERLGLGYDALRADNPDLIYLSANGYGPDGPGALRPSTHPIPGAALGGVVWQMGGLPGPGPMTLAEVREVARRLFRANEVNPDPNTSMVIATAAMLGLLARDLTGKGQEIFVDMFGANAYANWDDFLSYPGKPERAPLDDQGLGLRPGQRLYQCRDGWVFVFATDDADLMELGTTDTAELEKLFRSRDVASWSEALKGPAVYCLPADAGWPADFLLSGVLAETEELVVPVSHPEWGDYLRHGPMVRFGAERSYPGPSQPGDASESLLAELGYSQDQIKQLCAEDVVSAGF